MTTAYRNVAKEVGKVRKKSLTRRLLLLILLTKRQPGNCIIEKVHHLEEMLNGEKTFNDCLAETPLGKLIKKYDVKGAKKSLCTS